MTAATTAGEDPSYAEFLSYLKSSSSSTKSSDELPANTIDSTVTSTKASSPTNNNDSSLTPVPFLALFRHATPTDLLIIILGILFQSFVGVSFAAMNLVFGQLIDNLASPSGSVLDNVSGMIRIMAGLAVLFAVLASVAMSFIPYGAARIVNRVRLEYVKSVLRQDMTYFDACPPGSIVGGMSGETLEMEEGMSVKLGEGVQSCW